MSDSVDSIAPRLSKKRQALLGVLIYGSFAVAIVIGLLTQSLLAAMFVLFGLGGLILAVGSIATMVGMGRRRARR
ncbi:MAG TPA: hypothetical protein VIJ31_13060 [Acidothermaceae bacterium]